ncbi:MAG TPA: hypothetical protein VNH22_09950 [Blastocatellia bacterium]|jgi:hypothetical protein|nr:hypothetical protein [Blastocatellia bacterium]
MRNWETLDIAFEGYFMCRLTTDPDPTDEKRGVSGYTLALASETDLDNYVLLNPSEEYLKKNFRNPGPRLVKQRKLSLGVKVKSATVNGKEYMPASLLVGGAVNLLDRDFNSGDVGPTFEGRNDIVGSDDNVEFPIDPFIIDIRHPDHPGVRIQRKDVLAHDLPLWKLPPGVYQDRLGLPPALEPSLEVMEAIGVYDFSEYFNNRAKDIEGLIKNVDQEEAETGMDKRALEEMYKTRLYVIEFFGDRIRSRLGMQRIWNFHIEGSTGLIEGIEEAERKLDPRTPWPVSFWFGGYDGDLMIGYMRGVLHVPFE